MAIQLINLKVNRFKAVNFPAIRCLVCVTHDFGEKEMELTLRDQEAKWFLILWT